MFKKQRDQNTREQFNHLSNQNNVFAEGENEKLTVYLLFLNKS